MRSDDPWLLDNRHMALARLQSLKGKLKSDKNYFTQKAHQRPYEQPSLSANDMSES